MSTAKDTQSALHFGARLAFERKRLSLSQKDAAEYCGVRREMWGRYERGDAEPGVGVLEHFCALGAKPGVLLGTKALEDVDAAHAVLDEIAAQLGLFNRMHELEGIGAQLLRDRAALLGDPYERKYSSRSPDVSPWSFQSIHQWLSQSPYFLPSTDQLERVIERLEFALSVSGKDMEPYDKAAAILKLCQEAKNCPTEREAERALNLRVREVVERVQRQAPRTLQVSTLRPKKFPP